MLCFQVVRLVSQLLLVTTMDHMFYNTKISDVSALSSWNVSAVTNMTSLFSTCSNLTSLSFRFQLILFSVTTMLQMFYGCSNLTLDSLLIYAFYVFNVF